MGPAACGTLLPLCHQEHRQPSPRSPPCRSKGCEVGDTSAPGGLRADPRARGRGRGPEGQPRGPSRAVQRAEVGGDLRGRPQRGHCEEVSGDPPHTPRKGSLGLGRALGPRRAVSPAAQRLRSHCVLRLRAAGGWDQEPCPPPLICTWTITPKASWGPQ